MSRRRTRLPIGVQLVALLVASLLAAQAINIALLFALPPPRPALYRLSEVAGALKGGSLLTRDGRPLTRAAAAGPPTPKADTDPMAMRAQMSLAATLGRPVADVRLYPDNGAPFFGMMNRRSFGVARGDGPPRGEPGPALRTGPGPDGDIAFVIRPGGPPPPGPEFKTFERSAGFRPRPGDVAVFGDFTAAVRNPGGGWTVVASTPEPFPNDWQRRALLWLLGGFLLVAPAGYLFARRITAPLKRFSDAADRLGRDPMGPEMSLRGPAELGAAAEALNQMQSRLRRFISDRTAMVGAISHDLRTPLARIRFKLEAAPPALRSAILSDVGQMEQMIEGVLAFIRDETLPRQRERLDLLSLVECVVDDAALVGADVELAEDSAPVIVEGDPSGLRRLFGNLVDNAVKYGGEARVRVSRDGDMARVEIDDAGPGLAPEDLRRAFDPFYRADASRNLDQGGVGLGLPIARATARGHGGEVVLRPQAVGLRAIVTLPVAPD
ncbi:MAG: HAMP domain-containing sensor histidine kinase [Caulobacter sp.]|nr:HAMP domain-containing sensor histidine kinase [Caulobacter sp.]